MKRYLTTLLALVAIATGAWAATDYGFSIAGVPITSDNYLSPSQNKAWNYDPNQNVLYLTDGTISCLDSGSAVIEIDGDINPTLNICVQGYCKVWGTVWDIILFWGEGQHMIYGNGTLELASQFVGNQSLGSEPYGIRSYGNTSLTIKDITLLIKVYQGTGIKSDRYFSDITMDNCEVSITTASGEAWKSTSGTQVIFKRCEVESPNYYYIVSGIVINGAMGSHPWAADATIKRVSVYNEFSVTVPAPSIGETVSFTPQVNGSGYEVTKIEWDYLHDDGTFSILHEGHKFQRFGVYRVIMYLAPTEGGRIDHESELTATINGQPVEYIELSSYYDADQGDSVERVYISYTFPELGNESYDLFVGGTQVTAKNMNNVLGDGKVSYNPDMKILTLNNAVINSTGQGNHAIMNENPYYYGRAVGDLTIEVIGNCQLTSEDVALIISGNTTIEGNGTLTLKSTTEKGIWIDNQTLECKVNKLIVDAYKEPIYGIGDGSGMRINGSYVELNSRNPNTFKTVDCLALFTLQNSHFSDPGGAWKYAETDNYIYNTPYRRLDLGTEIYRGKLLIEPNTTPVRYRLWVAGTRVTSANKNNISISSGTAMFDPDTHTLTLNNAKIVADRYDDGISNGYIDTNIEGMPDFKIVCSGNNIIEPELGAGLALNGNTTISGGKLVINADINGIDLGELKKLTFQNADVYTEASYPIRCRYNSVVNVNHSRLEADPGSSQNSPVYGPIAFNMLYCEYADPGNGINPEQLFYNDDEQILEMYYGQYPYDGTLLIVPTNEVITTGVALPQDKTQSQDAWYTLDGRKLNGQPTKKGVYIHNGKTVIR